MGYNTYYTLEIAEPFRETVRCEHVKPDTAKFCPECGKPTTPTVIEDKVRDWLAEQPQDSNGYGILDLLNNKWGEATWYKHQEDMKPLSKAFPDVLFILSGEGEEGGDLWKEYYLNGKVQVARAVITYPSFNKNKLEAIPARNERA